VSLQALGSRQEGFIRSTQTSTEFGKFSRDGSNASLRSHPEVGAHPKPTSAAAVHGWTAGDVAEWLQQTNLASCAANFYEEKVDGVGLLEMAARLQDTQFLQLIQQSLRFAKFGEFLIFLSELAKLVEA